jgi:hypothetical protein
MDRRRRSRRDAVDDTDQPPAAAGAPPERTDVEHERDGPPDEEPRVGAVRARDEEQPL